MKTHQQAALELNALATELNESDGGHPDLTQRLIELTDAVSNGPSHSEVTKKKILVEDLRAEGLPDWADRLASIHW